jgi:hypothetical protein
MSPWDKGRLIAEILRHYAPLLRALRRDELVAVLATARDQRGAGAARLGAQEEHETALRLGSIVARVLKELPTDSRCLIQSVVLLRVLARRGIEADLVIGIHDDGGFAAHAWVEHERHALLPAGNFEQLARL